jgi:hypothetical protein
VAGSVDVRRVIILAKKKMRENARRGESKIHRDCSRGERFCRIVSGRGCEIYFVRDGSLMGVRAADAFVKTI